MSTFTLKRKTYTEYDYCNNIATVGFQEGFNYAYEKLFSEFSELAIRASKKFPSTSVFDLSDAKRIARGKTKNIFGTDYNKDLMDYVKSEYNKMKGVGNPASSARLQQRTASFIGKGYLY